MESLKIKMENNLYMYSTYITYCTYTVVYIYIILFMCVPYYTLSSILCKVVQIILLSTPYIIHVYIYTVKTNRNQTSVTSSISSIISCSPPNSHSNGHSESSSIKNFPQCLQHVIVNVVPVFTFHCLFLSISA